MVKRADIENIKPTKIIPRSREVQFTCYSNKYEELVGTKLISLYLLHNQLIANQIRSRLYKGFDKDGNCYFLKEMGHCIWVNRGENEFLAGKLPFEVVGSFTTSKYLDTWTIFSYLGIEIPEDYMEFD